MREYTRPLWVFVAAAGLFFAAPGLLRAQQQDAQNQQAVQRQSGTEGAKVAPGQTVDIKGVVLKRDANSLQIQGRNGSNYLVALTGSTDIREKKSNPFRGAKTYTQQQLLPGMMVEIKGRGENSGNITADQIRFTNNDLQVAEAIDARVSPVEQNLSQTTTRLGQAEQNAQRMSGQLEELSSVANAARGGAKAAQDTADTAMQNADKANVGVEAANSRISNIDDYQVKDSATVKFKVGSAILTKEAQEELDKIAQDAKNEKAFVIEVSGYASSEGSKALNQRLSQRRADQVIRYLAENYDIPLRRFVSPMGLGTTHPVADNGTRTGREENRRVEIKVLVSSGLSQPATGGSTTTGSVR